MKTKVNYKRSNKSENPFNEVAYAIYGNQIVFTGTYDGKANARTSTLNGAESIILAITMAEEIDPRKFKFYDLQTKSSYCGFKRFGDYNLQEVIVGGWHGTELTPIAYQIRWDDCHGCEEVFRDFQEFIWGEEIPAIPRNLAVAHGRMRELPETPKSLADLLVLN
ncbi:MAG: hypothetical protein JWO73_264 [Candidatus Taylorbacteria bacterium]|nr:hypothetical protein [Candidatus Taylorbacteria bacterium]